jgi:predicted O-methyltransferase YrrM
LGEERLWVLYQAARNTARLALPCAEIGAFQGGSAYFLASVLQHFHGEELPFHVVDTFEGHPDGQLTVHDYEGHVAGLFGQTSYESVRHYLSPFARTQVHRGAFADVVHNLPDGRYGFAHLDVDVYKPLLESLQFFGQRLAVGGVLVLDDYGARKCPGVRKAAETFTAEHDSFQAWHPFTEQLLLIKVR